MVNFKYIRSPLSRGRQQGQGMTEYIVIVALVAVAAIGTYSLFGKTVRAQMAGITSELAGVDASGDISNATSAAGLARAQGGSNYNLGTYNTGAQAGN